MRATLLQEFQRRADQQVAQQQQQTQARQLLQQLQDLQHREVVRNGQTVREWVVPDASAPDGLRVVATEFFADGYSSVDIGSDGTVDLTVPASPFELQEANTEAAGTPTMAAFANQLGLSLVASTGFCGLDQTDGGGFDAQGIAGPPELAFPPEMMANPEIQAMVSRAAAEPNSNWMLATRDDGTYALLLVGEDGSYTQTRWIAPNEVGGVGPTFDPHSVELNASIDPRTRVDTLVSQSQQIYQSAVTQLENLRAQGAPPAELAAAEVFVGRAEEAYLGALTAQQALRGAGVSEEDAAAIAREAQRLVTNLTVAGPSSTMSVAMEMDHELDSLYMQANQLVTQWQNELVRLGPVNGQPTAEQARAQAGLQMAQGALQAIQLAKEGLRNGEHPMATLQDALMVARMGVMGAQNPDEATFTLGAAPPLASAAYAYTAPAGATNPVPTTSYTPTASNSYAATTYAGNTNAAPVAAQTYAATGTPGWAGGGSEELQTIMNAPLFSPDEQADLALLKPEDQAMMRLQRKAQRYNLIVQCLTNIFMMDHEAKKSIAQNIRG